MGSMEAARVVMSVVVALLIFLALGEFISATLVWFGNRVDVPDFTFEVTFQQHKSILKFNTKFSV